MMMSILTSTSLLLRALSIHIFLTVHLLPSPSFTIPTLSLHFAVVATYRSQPTTLKNLNSQRLVLLQASAALTLTLTLTLTTCYYIGDHINLQPHPPPSFLFICLDGCQ